MSIDRGTPTGRDRAFEQGPQSANRLLAFFRANGERFLGQEIAKGDELLPVKARLIEPEKNRFLRSQDALATQLSTDAILISAFVLGMAKLQYIAQNDVPANLIPDIIEAVSDNRDISEQTATQLDQVLVSFEARKHVIDERSIRFTEREQFEIMAKAAKILPVATRAVLGKEDIFTAPLILAAFIAIDEGFNENGDARGAALPPSMPPGSGLTGVTADLPRRPNGGSAGAEAEAENLVSSAGSSRRS